MIHSHLGRSFFSGLLLAVLTFGLIPIPTALAQIEFYGEKKPFNRYTGGICTRMEVGEFNDDLSPDCVFIRERVASVLLSPDRYASVEIEVQSDVNDIAVIDSSVLVTAGSLGVALHQLDVSTFVASWVSDRRLERAQQIHPIQQGEEGALLVLNHDGTKVFCLDLATLLVVEDQTVELTHPAQCFEVLDWIPGGDAEIAVIAGERVVIYSRDEPDPIATLSFLGQPYFLEPFDGFPHPYDRLIVAFRTEDATFAMVCDHLGDEPPVNCGLLDIRSMRAADLNYDGSPDLMISHGFSWTAVFAFNRSQIPVPEDIPEEEFTTFSNDPNYVYFVELGGDQSAVSLNYAEPLIADIDGDDDLDLWMNVGRYRFLGVKSPIAESFQLASPMPIGAQLNMEDEEGSRARLSLTLEAPEKPLENSNAIAVDVWYQPSPHDPVQSDAVDYQLIDVDADWFATREFPEVEVSLPVQGGVIQGVYYIQMRLVVVDSGRIVQSYPCTTAAAAFNDLDSETLVGREGSAGPIPILLGEGFFLEQGGEGEGDEEGIGGDGGGGLGCTIVCRPTLDPLGQGGTPNPGSGN